MLQTQIRELEAERHQAQRALEALFRIGMACRSAADPQTLLSTICDELSLIWQFDACYIALCDADDKDFYRMALLVDGAEREFIERAEIGTLTRYVLDRRKPMLIQDLVVERVEYGLPPATFFGSERPSRAWMGVPLAVGQDALGVISLQSYTVGLYQDHDIELLTQLAASMALALENATLSHRQGQLSRSLAEQVALRNADLFVISDIAAMLTQQQNLAETFGTALDFLLESLALQVGAIGQVSGTTMQLIASHGLAGVELPLNDGTAPTIIGAAIAAGQTISSDDPEFARWAQIEGLTSVPHQVVLPLLRTTQVIGVLIVGSTRPRQLRAEEVELLQVVSNQLALALEQGIILEQRNRQIAELETMQRISYAAGRSMDLSSLLREVHDALDALMSIDVFYMAIYDAERGVLTDSMAIESDHEERYQLEDQPPQPGSFTAWVIRHRNVLFIHNVSTELEGYPELVRRVVAGLPVETWLGVPLLDTDEQVLGLISIQSYRAFAFRGRDRFFLQTVASQVGLHVRTLQLFKQRERQLAELNALQRISELISSTLDLEAMIMSIDEVLSSFLGVDAFFVALYNSDEDAIEGIFALEQGQLLRFDELVGRPLPPRTPTAWVVRNARPMRLTNVPLDTASHPELEPMVLEEPPAVSWLGVPLLDRNGRAVGVLTIQGYQISQFSARDEQFMLQVARQLTLTVQNARLFAERERQLAELDSLQRITQLISSTLELDPMLRSIDVILREFLGADAFQVIIYDSERQRVELAVISEQGREVPTRLIGEPLPEGTFMGWTLRNAQPLRVGNVYRDWASYTGLKNPAQPDGQPKPSWLGVPLLASEEVPLGVLAVRSYAEDAFSAQDEQFLLNVGRQLSLSVRNARLFAAEQTAHRTADTLREVARILNTSFDPDQVLAVILRELKQVIAYDSASVMLPAGTMLRTVARQDTRLEPDIVWRDLLFPIDLSSGAGRVMVQQESLFIEDTTSVDNWTSSPMPAVVRSWLGVPLVNKGVVLGVLNINGLIPNAFTPQDLEIANAFANLAATALAHARLYKESVTRVEQELEIAHRIQSNLFPRHLPLIPGFSLGGVCIPARETGGDFYDVQPLRNNQWALIIGDASGKSIPGAMLMAVARSVIRSEARDHESPRVVMDETNRWISLDVPANSFVALAYATINSLTRSISLSNAGQLEPICLRTDGSLEYLGVPGPRLPLGINADIAYQTATYTMAPGDVMVFYTDGIVEAHNPQGELWGFERLEAALQEYGRTLEPPAVIEQLLSDVSTFIGDRHQHDDMTLVVLRADAIVADPERGGADSDPDGPATSQVI